MKVVKVFLSSASSLQAVVQEQMAYFEVNRRYMIENMVCFVATFHTAHPQQLLMDVSKLSKSHYGCQ